MATRPPPVRRAGTTIDVEDELQQLLKEQEDFMRQNQRPAAKITRMSGEEMKPSTPARDEVDDEEERMEDGPQLVGAVQERDVVELLASNRNVQPRAAVGGFPAVRRRGESLFGRRQRQQPVATVDPSKMLSGMGAIVERMPAVSAASTMAASTMMASTMTASTVTASTVTASTMTASASTTTRSDVVDEREWMKIDESNTAALQSMSTAAIRDAQKELYQMLDPELIAKLKNRRRPQPAAKRPQRPQPPPRPRPQAAPVVEPTTAESTHPLQTAGIDLAKVKTEDELMAQAQRLPPEERAKHAWMQSVDAAELATPTRHPVRQQRAKKPKTVASSERFDFNGDCVHRASTSSIPVHSGLYHHGDDPDAAGYTMDELLHLARSTVASQRTVALTTIGKILCKRQQQPQRDRLPRILPAELAVTLRMALDDQNYTALSAAIAALEAFLCPVRGAGEDDVRVVEEARGTVVATPRIHVHVDADTTTNELLHEVVYIDTGESEEDGRVIADQEFTALDPVQGMLKMTIITRLSYVVDTVQLPDEDAMDRVLSILIRIAMHSPRGAEAIAVDKKLIKALQTKYLENEVVLTLQTEPADRFMRAVGLTTKTLMLVRTLCQGSRAVANSMMECGLIHSTKGFLALRLDTSSSSDAPGHSLDRVHVEGLRIWRVLLGYGLDFHCFSYLYPLLCGFDGVQLVRDGSESTKSSVKRWSDASLAAIFAALEAFVKLATIHEVQHYFSQLGVFLQLAKDEVAHRVTCPSAVLSAALRFLSVCTGLVTRFHLPKAPFMDTFRLLQTQLKPGSSLSQSLLQSHGAGGLVGAVTTFLVQVVEKDLLGDDEDEEEVRLQLLMALKPLLSDAISSSVAAAAAGMDATLAMCELLLLAMHLVVTTGHHDDEFLRLLYSAALSVVQDLKPGHQFWIHSLFSQILFKDVVLQKAGLFPDLHDATTMSRVLTPIYQALVNSTKPQEEHSRTLFASHTVDPKEKQTCHLVVPQHEHEFMASNLPLPFFWMFCPLSRLEYAAADGDDPQKMKRSAAVLGPSHAQSDEMKVIVSAACRYIEQLESIVPGGMHNRSATDPRTQLGDEDKLFHLMHVFFAGADVLFDDYVDLALAKLLKTYALRTLQQQSSPTILYHGILRNLQQFEMLESGEAKPRDESTPSFTTDEGTVMTFVERLVNEFTASSFGNTHFARLVTLFVMHDFPLSIRKWVWKELAGSHLLHRLGSFDGVEARTLTGLRATRDAKKSDETLIRAMKQAVASRSQAVLLTEARGPFAYWIIIHHVVAYVFGDDEADAPFSFSRQKLLQDLVSDASSTVWRHLLSYDVSQFTPSPETPIKQQRVDRVVTQGGLTEAQVATLRQVLELF